MKSVLKNVLVWAKVVLAQLAQLSNPVTDAAFVALILKLLPFVHIATGKLVAYAACVGLVATWLKNALSGIGVKVADEKAARAKAGK